MHLAAYLHWNADPELFSIGALHIRWYGLFFAIAFLCGYQIMDWVFRREDKPHSDLDPLFLYMVLGTVIGARLGHCFFYRPRFFLAHPLEILMVWRGGLASHGAAIGIITALYLFTLRHKSVTYLWILSRITLVVALSGLFIRTGNFFNAEIVGTPTDLPWGVIFMRYNPPGDMTPRHPAMLYEALSYFLIFLVLLRTYIRGGKNTKPELLLGIFFTLIFTARFVIEFVKEVQESFEYSLPLHMGQLLSLPLIALGLYLLWRARRADGGLHDRAA